MNVFYELGKEIKPTAIALGYFDGVHIGHEKVIMKAVSYRSQGLKPIILTFKSSPRSVLQGVDEQRLLPLETKIKIFSDMGVESLYVVDFDKIKNLSAEEFVKEVLFDILNVRQAICGFNYTFGIGGKANSEDLKFLGACSGIGVDVVPSVKYRDEAVSSTRIRKAIINKNIRDVREMTRNLSLI